MAKNKINVVHIGILLVLVVIAYMLFTGKFGNINNWYGGNTYTDVPTVPDEEYGQYNVFLDTDKAVICKGDDLRVTISSNINNGQCAIFYNYNSQGWNVLQGSVRLDANGDFTTIKQMNNAAGYYLGRVVCGDMQGNWRTSNIVPLTINDCGNDGDDEDGTDEGTPPMACSGVWMHSVANCEAAVCPNSEDCCKYVPATSYAPDRCECQPEINSCNEYCNSLTNAGFTSGSCGTLTVNGLPRKNPCAYLGTHVSTGDTYCPKDPHFTATNEWCCCS